MNESLVGKVTLVVSVAVHAWVFSVKAARSADHVAPSAAQQVEFSTFEPEPPVEVEPEPEVEEPEPQLPPVEPEEAPPSFEPAPPDSPQREVQPAELTGTTLASDAPSDWKAPLGSGRARRGSFRAGVSRPVPRAFPGAPKVAPRPPRPAGPPTLPLSELSKPPVPPELGRALERNYPKVARRQGKSGEAKVRARVESNGKIREAKVVFESESGFGDACRKTLVESKWSAPRGPAGERVATWVSYRCRFRSDG